MNLHTHWMFRGAMPLTMLLTSLLVFSGCAPKDPGLFETPEAAVQAMHDLIGQGEDEWPFPIPLMREEGGWRFNTEAGREEILNR